MKRETFIKIPKALEPLIKRFSQYGEKLEKERINNELLTHKRKLNDLTWQNAALEWNTKELKSQNEQLERNTQELKRQNEAFMEEKRREQQNIYNFKMSFEESKKNIEKINLEKSKEYITKLIVNKFVKEFDNEEGKKNPFTISLIDQNL